MADRSAVEVVISRVGRAQHGLVTRRQLLAAGVSPGVVNRHIHRGRLERVHPGVYAAAGAPRTWEQAALAACLRAGPEASLSHRSAAAVWGLAPQRWPVEVVVPHEGHRGKRSDEVVVHRSRSLHSADRAVVRGLPVTTVARTLVDLAATETAETVAVAVDDALCRRIVAPGRLLAAVERLATRGRRRAARLRGLLEPWLSGNGFDSVAEGVFRRRLREAGLPPPVTQYEVHDGDRLVARLDLAWPDRRVALEVDGFRWHANPRSFASDADRASRLAALDWVVLRATPAQLATNPRIVLDALRRRFASNAAA